MSSYDTTDRTAYITLGAMFGAAVGVVAGMLMAPRSGEEMRAGIGRRAQNAKGKAQEQLNSTRDQAMDKLSKTLDKSQEVADKTASKTKEVANRTSERAKSAARDAQEEVETNRARRSTTNNR